MIIDDAHKVAFVHIPKCAGTSVRRQLQLLDSYDGFFFDRRDHEVLGAIDYCHLPLVFLERHFPDAFAKLCDYRSFALVRDPLTRFVSAIFERLALFKGVTGTTATAEIAIREADEVMRWLEGRAAFCEAPFIHFARQTDYVALGGRAIVGNVYALEDMAGFGAAIGELTGVSFDPGRRENINFASSNRLLSVLHHAKPIYARLTTWDQRQAILKQMNRWRVASPDRLYTNIRENPDIRAFVGAYYADDVALHAAARARIDARGDGRVGSRSTSPAPEVVPS